MPDARTSMIAVVDDDFRVLESMKELLEAGGYTVRPFSSAQAFLDENILFEIDCVVSDIGMPVMDGIELHRRALTMRPDLPFIFITAREEAIKRLTGRDDHHGFFRKPFDPNALLNAISIATTGA